MKPVWIRAAEYAGITLQDEQIRLIERYGEWLVTEAWRAGGIGPAERERVEARHLADSIVFASCFPGMSAEVWDLGSGVGLPGIPLAICLPATRFLLIDRSGRRIDLMNRAIRILELDNCEVIQSDIHDLVGDAAVIVSRASLSPERLQSVIADHLLPGGVMVAAGSWRERPRFPGWTTVEIPADVLDRTVWLLIMRRE